MQLPSLPSLSSLASRALQLVTGLSPRVLIGVGVALLLLGSTCYAYSRGKARGHEDQRLAQLDSTLHDVALRLPGAIVRAQATKKAADDARQRSDSIARLRAHRQAEHPVRVVDSATVLVDTLRITTDPHLVAEIVDLRAQRAADSVTIVRQDAANAALAVERDLWKTRALTAEAKADVLERAKRPRFSAKEGAAAGAAATLLLLGLLAHLLK